MCRKSEEKRVLVALSGGVDSSVAAALLQESGYQIEGAIMVLEGISDKSIDMANKAADKLQIPFHRFDFRGEHKEKVIDYFVREYQWGRTPNPCVVCNRRVKFSLFMQKAQRLGIGHMATGHYAGIEKKFDRYVLKKGIDKNEQSYFLYGLSQRQLSRAIFPLAQYIKERVRAVARRYDLPTAQRKKSQDICFIPNGNYASFLRNRIPENAGPILNSHGKQIGQHRGIIHYTIGQRHGIGISHRYPYYVTKIDVAKNAIYVGEKKQVYKKECIARDLNFIPFDTLEQRMNVAAKVRYFSPPAEAVVEPIAEDKVRVVFEKKQWAITPGQSIVFYQEDLVVGGGIIT